MPVIAAHLLEPDQGNMQVYNGLDAALTFEINEALADLRRNDETTYRFELSMQAPALEMMLRGMRVDPVAREKAIRETRAKLDCTNGIIARLAEAIQGSYKPTLANSGTQLRELFYHSMGYRELRVSVKGESKVPMDRKVLERLEAMHYHARPIINAILLARDLSKQLQVMETEIDPDWRFRCSYNIGGTSTGRWCLSGETEVLTKQGWTKIKDVEETQTIAVWNQHKDIQWQESKKLVFDNSKPLIKIQNDRFSLEVTDEHRLPYFTSKRNLNVAIAKDRKQLHTAPLSGNLSANFLDKKLTNVIVMTQADGTIVHNNLIRFHFRKERKIERCKKNLEECGIPFKYTLSEADGTSYIYVYDPPEWMKQAKLLDSWLLDHDPFHFINEVRQWDGYIDPRNGGCEYSTTVKQNAEWVQTMAHLMGCCATVKARPERGNWNISYRVWIGTTDNTRIHKYQYEDKDTIDDKVYCMETSTGFFLVRHNGLICVTGNSSSKSGTGTGGNFQNVSEELRRIFIPDIGYKLYGIDLEQAEAREVAWFCFTILGDASYLDACESGDLHTAVARLVWPNFAWTGDLKADRKIADQRFYRHYTYRDMCKKLAHGSNYYGKPPALHAQTKVPLKLVREFQERYFEAFPCIQRMHQWVAQELQRTGFLTNSFGRRRDFFDRADSEETLRGAIAFLFQSATGDRLNLGLYRIWKHMPGRVQILSQLHDAVYFQAREEDEAEIIPEALERIQVWLQHGERKFTIRGEAKGGHNWANRFRLNSEGNAVDWNPRGLDKIRL